MSHEKHAEQPKKEEQSKEKQEAKSEQKEPKPHEKKDQKDEKLSELTNLLQHVQADFENYKKRTEKEQQNNIMLGKALIVKRILPVLDTFDHALKEHKGDADGLKRVYSQLISALEAEGLRPIKAVGEKLDPYRHECLEEECSDQCKGMVLEEIQKGYILNDYIIRHSLVKVSGGKKPETKEPAKQGPETKDRQKE